MEDLLVLDTNFVPVDVLDVYNSLIWTERYCGHGDFEIYTPMSFNSYNLLKEDHYLQIKSSDNLMIIEKRHIKSNLESGDQLFITGRSLESILDRRIIWSQTLLSGDFQIEMLILMYQNVTNPSDLDRTIPGLIYQISTDPYIDALTIDKQETGNNLYSTIYDVCKANDLGFRINLTPNNEFLFEFYYGVDHSYDQIVNPWVVFSKSFDNILSSEHTFDKTPLKTVSLVLGAGDGSERKASLSVIPGGAGVGLSRREMYTDASGISEKDDAGIIIPEIDYLAQLTQKGKEELAKNVCIDTFEGEVDATGTFIFGRDFGLGDIVQVENEYGNKSKARVTEIIRSTSPTGSIMYPTFTTV